MVDTLLELNDSSNLLFMPIAQHEVQWAMTTANQALTDELEAVNSIYDSGTLVIDDSHNHALTSTSTSTSTDTTTTTTTILKLPNLPFSFQISFPNTYPDVPPTIVGTQSTGPNTRKGEGEYALNVLRDVLGRVYVPGLVCLFDLIEEGGEAVRLHQQEENSSIGVDGRVVLVEGERGRDHGSVEDYSEGVEDRSALPPPPPPSSSSSMSLSLSQVENLSISDLTSDFSSTAASSISSIPPPNWVLSEPLVFNKSTFVARALAVSSLGQARDSISHLLGTNKKVAGATHNITAWRIKQQQQQHQQQRQAGDSKGSTTNASGAEIVIQDCDDDGETAAGGRLLHLMQLMDVWNVVVIVTRWYGGVKLGPDRFRLINSVAREALVAGGFAKEEETKIKGKSGKKK